MSGGVKFLGGVELVVVGVELVVAVGVGVVVSARVLREFAESAVLVATVLSWSKGLAPRSDRRSFVAEDH
jgi:hypothetical protein